MALGVAAEALRPVVIRKDGVRTCSRLGIVCRGENPARRRLDSECAEHPTGNVLPIRLLVFLIRPVGQIRTIRIGSRYRFGLVVDHAAHPFEHGIGATVISSQLSVHVDVLESNRHEPIGMCDRQWPPQQRIDQPERRSTRTDRQCER